MFGEKEKKNHRATFGLRQRRRKIREVSVQILLHPTMIFFVFDAVEMNSPFLWGLVLFLFNSGGR